LHIRRIRQALDRASNHHGHCVVAAWNVEAERCETVMQVGQQTDIAVLRDPARHVAELLANAGRVHVENDAGKRARSLRTNGEARLATVLRLNHHVMFDHGITPTAGPSLALGMTKHFVTPRDSALLSEELAFRSARDDQMSDCT